MRGALRIERRWCGWVVLRRAIACLATRLHMHACQARRLKHSGLACIALRCEGVQLRATIEWYTLRGFVRGDRQLACAASMMPCCVAATSPCRRSINTHGRRVDSGWSLRRRLCRAGKHAMHGCAVRAASGARCGSRAAEPAGAVQLRPPARGHLEAELLAELLHDVVAQEGAPYVRQLVRREGAERSKVRPAESVLYLRP